MKWKNSIDLVKYAKYPVDQPDHQREHSSYLQAFPIPEALAGLSCVRFCLF